MNLDSVNKKRKDDAMKLRSKIKRITNIRKTIKPKEIQEHLQREFGLTANVKTIRAHLKGIKLELLKKTVIIDTALKQEKTLQKKEIRKAKKAEKRQNYPYYVTSPCPHKNRVKITSNLVQSSECWCGCGYDRFKRVWRNMSTGKLWSESDNERVKEYSEWKHDFQITKERLIWGV